MRLIDADALKAEINLMFGDKTHITESICDLIDNAPTVEPEKVTEGELVKAYTKGFDAGVETVRPQGEWIIHNKGEHNEWHECPYCNNHKKYYARFCNYCGADMRGEKK